MVEQFNVPPGYVLVPLEPTPEMIRAGQELKPVGKWHTQIRAVYAAMLDAAPHGVEGKTNG